MPPSSGWRRWPAVVVAIALLPTLAVATDVRVVAITPGRNAKVMIDGRAPIAIDVGQTVAGVTLVRADPEGALVSVDGTTRTLSLEAAETRPAPAVGAGPTSPVPTRAVRTAASGRDTVTLFADSRGHFWTPGTVNGKPLTFLVDTGATSVALSRSDADRLGLDYRSAKPSVSMTANGPVRGWPVPLRSVRVGAVTVRNVEATVIDGRLPFALLGMSFLNRFDMNRQGSKLVLQRRGR